MSYSEKQKNSNCLSLLTGIRNNETMVLLRNTCIVDTVRKQRLGETPAR